MEGTIRTVSQFPLGLRSRLYGHRVLTLCTKSFPLGVIKQKVLNYQIRQ
jgi:hypothetical protein